jgi:hypothetical protein
MMVQEEKVTAPTKALEHTKSIDLANGAIYTENAFHSLTSTVTSYYSFYIVFQEGT